MLLLAKVPFTHNSEEIVQTDKRQSDKPVRNEVHRIAHTTEFQNSMFQPVNINIFMAEEKSIIKDLTEPFMWFPS